MTLSVTQAVAQATTRRLRELHGVVVTAGLMDKTVKVRVGGQKWNAFLKKFFDKSETYLVHDPNNSLRTGDVVAIEPGFRTSKSKRHVVKAIIAPAGTPIAERPPIPTAEERWTEIFTDKVAKDERKVLRQRALAATLALERTAIMARKAQKEIALRARLLGVHKKTAKAEEASV